MTPAVLRTRAAIQACLVLGFVLAPVPAVRAEGAEVPLWPQAVSQPSTPAERPRLLMYLPPADQRCGTAVVICPGGGYGSLALDHEGRQVAAWLNRHGISAMVLIYRHRGSGFGHPAPLQDVQRAVRTVRSQAGEWGLAEDRIGVLGFSAGGHLASCAATHFAEGDADAVDPIDRHSSRPDFVILVYPVITMTEPWLHRRSRDNLLGRPAEPAAALEMSSEKQVTPRTPPAFLVHSSDDAGVPVENSLAFCAALRRAAVPVELHVFDRGGHGYGLGKAQDGTDAWPQLCMSWMRRRGLIPATEVEKAP